MRTTPTYIDYLKTIESIKVDIDCDHYITFTPKERTVVVDEKDLIEKYIEVKIVDETVSDFLVFEASANDISQHIKVMQDLVRQLNNTTSSTSSVSKC